MRLELMVDGVGPDFTFFQVPVYVVISDKSQRKRTCSHEHPRASNSPNLLGVLG